MVRFEFNDIRFEEGNDKIKIIFLKHFYSFLRKDDLSKIGNFYIGKNFIEFKASEKKSSKFNFLLEDSFKNLKNSMGKPVTYVHKNSGIPLIGTGYFGIIDRGSNLIELKPVTGCNIDCIYCSVDANKRERDFVVEKEYLVQELKKVAIIKENLVEVHISAQGEPLLYEPLVSLIKDIRGINNVKEISLETNGILLSKELVETFQKAGLTKINLSLNSLNQKTVDKMSGCTYPLNKIKDIAEYIAKKMELVIAPVLVEGINEDDLSSLIEFSKKIKAKIGIQNYLNYRHGKNIKKQMAWEKFYSILEDLENKHKLKLILSNNDFMIKKDNQFPKPFKKNQIIIADIVSEGRFKNEGLASSNNRCISVINFDSSKCRNEKCRIRIIRTKHNIFVGSMA